MKTATRPIFLLAATLYLALTALPLQAQTVPDTLDWKRYLPLEVGNVWEYHEVGAPQELERLALVSDTLANGHRYFRRVNHSRIISGNGDTLLTVRHDYVRYDAAGMVVSMSEPKADPGTFDPCAGDEWHHWFQRDLRLDFGATVACPNASAGLITVEGGYGPPPIATFPGPAWKTFQLNGLLNTTFVADIGPVSAGNLWGPRLHYAKIGGNEHGSPQIVVSRETPALQQSAAVELRVPVNPARAAVTFEVRAEHPQHVRLEVVDLLGRVVWTADAEVSQAWTRVDIPAGRLEAGSYVVRVAGASGRNSRAFTVVH